MDKPSLRKKMLAVRAAAHAAAGPAQWRKMRDHLFEVPSFNDAKTVLLYASKDSEAPTHDLIQKLLDEGRQVCLPIARVHDRTLELSFIRSLDELVVSSFGVSEPPLSSLKPCPPSAVQAAVIPGLAFDLHGYRLGYGLGFYDRFLPAVACPTIGLSYEAQLIDDLPHDAHDVPLNYLVTEKRLIEARHDIRPAKA